MTPDTEGMARLGVDAPSTIGVHISECGFEPYERDDGLHSPTYDPQPDYNDYLRRQGYNGDNPRHSWVNSGTNDDGDLLSGWFLNNSDRPARVPDEHSETPYMTNRAIDLLRETLDDPTGQPWLCHLSYIKPHWPYIVPAPYHDMYGIDDMQPPVRSAAERETTHPFSRAGGNDGGQRTAGPLLSGSGTRMICKKSSVIAIRTIPIRHACHRIWRGR